MGTTVGKQIDVGHVLSKSFELITSKPVLLVPQAIVLAISLLEDLARASTISALGIVLSLVSLIVTIIVIGAYPSLVQEALRGEPLSIGNSMRQAAGRFWSLVLAGILVGLLLLVGFILVVIPGIIFFTWYAYTVPAIMLEKKGALGGMSASRAFGRDKKWKTFLIFLAVFIVFIIIEVIMAGISYFTPMGGRVVFSLLSVPVDAWISVILTYTYLKYGPAGVAAQSQVITPDVVPPAPPGTVAQPGASAAQPSGRYCRYCGAQLGADARFCPSCGKPV